MEKKKRVKRILPWIIVILLLFALIILYVYGDSLHHAKHKTDYIGETKQETTDRGSKKGKGKEEYTSFESIPTEVTWTKDATTQTIDLSNLAENTVDLAPQIYVDLNKNGSFSEDECLYNADLSQRIAPGKSVNTITLSRGIPAGQYAAELVYRAYFEGSDTNANGMNFDFTAIVQ